MATCEPPLYFSNLSNQSQIINFEVNPFYSFEFKYKYLLDIAKLKRNEIKNKVSLNPGLTISRADKQQLEKQYRQSSEYLLLATFRKLKEFREYQKYKLKKRISLCSQLPWGNIACKSCSNVLTERPFKLTCLSNYCTDIECIRNRVRVIEFKLREFNIRSKELYTFTIGLKSFDIENLTNELRAKFQKAFLSIMKKLSENFPSLHYFSCFDMNKSKQSNNLIRLHYHVYCLPFNKEGLEEKIKLIINSIKKESGMEIAHSFGGWRKVKGSIEYASKRMAGIFGHNRKAEYSFFYKDIISIEQFYNIFYNKKTYHTNLKFRTRKSSELIKVLNNIPEKCPFCETSTNKNTYFEPLPPNQLKNITKPPPSKHSKPQNNEIVEVVDLRVTPNLNFALQELRKYQNGQR